MDNLIKHYHDLSYDHIDILYALAKKHNIAISKSYLEKRLKFLQLKKYKIESSLDIIIKKILEELEGSGQLLGYRSMWRRLKLSHKLKVKRETVEILLRQIDPEGVLARKRKKFKRREYSVPGPNFLWHLDGYDKLKPYGIPIHGCIDGFSRKIIWLKTCYSNNNPKVIAMFYLDSMIERNITPKLIRSDRGSENSLISGIQPFLRENHSDSLSGVKSFIYGKSTSNQRIERFWGHIRKNTAQYWMSLFKDMIDDQTFDNSDPLHIDCLRYCFMHLIQEDLDKVANEWNNHPIRKQKHEGVFAKPDILYLQPERFGGRECGLETDVQSINACKLIYCQDLSMTETNSAFEELVRTILPDIEKPETVQEAKMLFELIITIVNDSNQ